MMTLGPYDAILFAATWSVTPAPYRFEPDVHRAQVWRMTADERRRLFSPMNASGTFEPLVFATRLHGIEYDRQLLSVLKEDQSR